MRILLAEDEKDMSSALTAILQHSGYDVDSVYDGQAAMEKALENVYDCLIFDIMMPKMSGIDALKIIRQKGNLSPVIMLTAKSEIDDRITGLDAGADDYLMKPFSVGELLARIRSLTRRNTQFSPLTLSAGSVRRLLWQADPRRRVGLDDAQWSLLLPAVCGVGLYDPSAALELELRPGAAFAGRRHAGLSAGRLAVEAVVGDPVWPS